MHENTATDGNLQYNASWAESLDEAFELMDKDRLRIALAAEPLVEQRLLAVFQSPKKESPKVVMFGMSFLVNIADGESYNVSYDIISGTREDNTMKQFTNFEDALDHYAAQALLLLKESSANEIN